MLFADCKDCIAGKVVCIASVSSIDFLSVHNLSIVRHVFEVEPALNRQTHDSFKSMNETRAEGRKYYDLTALFGLHLGASMQYHILHSHCLPTTLSDEPPPLSKSEQHKGFSDRSCTPPL